MSTINERFLYYDTNCNLCVRYVTFMKGYDVHNKINYCSIYTYDGTPQVDSIIFRVAEEEYYKSTAVLQHWRQVGGWFGILARGCLIVPRFIRDALYDYVARNRYRWFGTCDC